MNYTAAKAARVRGRRACGLGWRGRGPAQRAVSRDRVPAALTPAHGRPGRERGSVGRITVRLAFDNSRTGAVGAGERPADGQRSFPTGDPLGSREAPHQPGRAHDTRAGAAPARCAGPAAAQPPMALATCEPRGRGAARRGAARAVTLGRHPELGAGLVIMRMGVRRPRSVPHGRPAPRRPWHGPCSVVRLRCASARGSGARGVGAAGGRRGTCLLHCTKVPTSRTMASCAALAKQGRNTFQEYLCYVVVLSV